VSVRFDETAFYRAVDDRRAAEQLTWRELGRKLGLSASTFSRLSRGHRPDVETFVRLLVWLNMPAAAFLTRTAETDQADSESALTAIAVALRQDPRLRPEDVAPLEDIVRIAYRRFQRAPAQ